MFFACDRQAPLVPDNGQAVRGVGTAVLRAAEQAMSADEFFLQVHQQLPSFAGLMYDNGVPTVYLTEPEQAANAQAALSPFLEKRGKAGRGSRYGLRHMTGDSFIPGA